VPSECIRYIASLICVNESPGNRVLYLTQLCGVCKRWRHELCGHTNLPVSFDGATDAGAAQKGSTLLTFRRADIANKRNTLLGASRLLAGASAVEYVILLMLESIATRAEGLFICVFRICKLAATVLSNQEGVSQMP